MKMIWKTIKTNILLCTEHNLYSLLALFESLLLCSSGLVVRGSALPSGGHHTVRGLQLPTLHKYSQVSIHSIQLLYHKSTVERVSYNHDPHILPYIVCHMLTFTCKVWKLAVIETAALLITVIKIHCDLLMISTGLFRERYVS